MNDATEWIAGLTFLFGSLWAVPAWYYGKAAGLGLAIDAINAPTTRRHEFLPGDLVKITLREDDYCNQFHNGKGVITHGPDDSGGWLVSSAPSGLRCVASELTLIEAREERIR
jgi:hypothetical protein